MKMQEPFDLFIEPHDYAVFPEGNQTYAVYKEGKPYLLIQKDEASQWIKFDSETAIPLFEEDAEVQQLGKLIDSYLTENPTDSEDDMTTFLY